MGFSQKKWIADVQMLIRDWQAILPQHADGLLRTVQYLPHVNTGKEALQFFENIKKHQDVLPPPPNNFSFNEGIGRFKSVWFLGFNELSQADATALEAIKNELHRNEAVKEVLYNIALDLADRLDK